MVILDGGAMIKHGIFFDLDWRQGKRNLENDKDWVLMAAIALWVIDGNGPSLICGGFSHPFMEGLSS